MTPLPDEFLLSHSDMFDDFANATHWPKHVLLHYDWRTSADVQFDNGLYVMLAAGECGFCVCVCVCARARARVRVYVCSCMRLWHAYVCMCCLRVCERVDMRMHAWGVFMLLSRGRVPSGQHPHQQQQASPKTLGPTPPSHARARAPPPGLLVALLVSLNNMAGLQSKLRAFLRDVVGDSDAAHPVMPRCVTGCKPTV